MLPGLNRINLRPGVPATRPACRNAGHGQADANTKACRSVLEFDLERLRTKPRAARKRISRDSCRFEKLGNAENGFMESGCSTKVKLQDRTASLGISITF